MHRLITHNTCDKTFAEFRDAVLTFLTFLREEVPRKRHILR
jgi:hypothetical protein